MDVKPWEPIRGGWEKFDVWAFATRHKNCLDCDVVTRECAPLYITLANGQRIIVRALSDERKAARAFNRRVKKAIEVNR